MADHYVACIIITDKNQNERILTLSKGREARLFNKSGDPLALSYLTHNATEFRLSLEACDTEAEVLIVLDEYVSLFHKRIFNPRWLLHRSA